MLSQWMLMAAATAIFLVSSVPAAEAAWFSVKGNGVARAERECMQSLPAFNRLLGKHGVRLTKATDCIEVAGENDAYVPTFEGLAEKPLAAFTAQGAPYRNRSGCEASLATILQAVASDGETVVEAACVPMSIVDTEADEMNDGYFQPTVFLLKATQ